MNPRFGQFAFRLTCISALSRSFMVIVSLALLLSNRFAIALPAVTFVSDPPTIGSIVVMGNRAIVRAMVVVTTGHKVGDPCTESTLQEMHDNLLRTGNYGLHSTNPADGVKIHSEPDPMDPSKCKVVIEVDENDVISGINIIGAGPIKPEEIHALLHLKEGIVYNPIQFRRDYEDIRQLYNRRGYAVTPAESAGFDLKNNLNVALVVARVTEIKVHNNLKTRNIVVLREMKTKQGDFFNGKKVLQDRLRLLNLGLFEKVDIDTHLVAPGEVALDINVNEKKIGTVIGGVSFSADEGVIGNIQISDDNFRGMGESLRLYTELASYINKPSVELDYHKPWLDSKQTGLGLSIYDKNQNRFENTLFGASGLNGRFIQSRIGANLSLSRPLNDVYRGLVTFRGESTHTDPIGLSGPNEAIVQDGPIYSLGTSLMHDTRDLIYDPVRGGFRTLSLSFGHADLKSPLPSGIGPEFSTGDQNYAKTALDWRMYYSLSGERRPDQPDAAKTSLAMRLMAGFSTGRLPFAEQYFVGGTDTLRGYREDRFWGSNLFLSSFELRQPVSHSFKVVAFVDMGDAWGGEFNILNLIGYTQSGFEPHVGAGFGVRVGTSLGSIRLDLGFGDEGARAHFGFGSSF